MISVYILELDLQNPNLEFFKPFLKINLKKKVQSVYPSITFCKLAGITNNRKGLMNISETFYTYLFHANLKDLLDIYNCKISIGD